jgi:hypothetical protein
MGIYRPMTVFAQCTAREDKTPALLSIGSMSPPGYPSAWLHPCRARFRFTWQSHCSSSTSIHPNFGLQVSPSLARKTQKSPFRDGFDRSPQVRML